MANGSTRSAARKITGVHFCGNDTQFLNGIAPRDLTPAEWGALPNELKQTALDSGLYTVTYHDDEKENA